MLFVFFSIARIIMLSYSKRNQELYICLINDYQIGCWALSVQSDQTDQELKTLFLSSPYKGSELEY